MIAKVLYDWSQFTFPVPRPPVLFQCYPPGTSFLLYKMTFEDFEDGVLYEYFRLYINSADITIMLTFTSAMNTRSWIDVCLIVENIDAESIFNNHYTFELSKFIPTIYRSIFDVLINNFNMKYDSIKINRMIEYLEPEDK